MDLREVQASLDVLAPRTYVIMDLVMHVRIAVSAFASLEIQLAMMAALSSVGDGLGIIPSA